MSAEVALERAERGAALLDEQRPGWEHRIDLAELDLASLCQCVLGQLFRHDAEDPWAYSLGTKTLGLFAPYLASHFGFTDGKDVTVAELDEAWIAIIKRRHDLGVFSDTV